MKPAWKQEISRRIASHRNRKGTDAASQPVEASQHLGSSRAAEAAARVAARYAKAPSYSQMQAEEARVAVRAAEIATQVALEAQATAEDALAELHAAAQAPAARGPSVVESIAREERAAHSSFTSGPDRAEEVAAEITGPLPFAEPIETAVTQMETEPPSGAELRPVTIRWDSDVPIKVHKREPREEFELSAEDWWTPAQVKETLHSEPIAVNPEPAHANVLEFPRELVATRRMRPRLAETPFVARSSQEAQLSIFEVDPGAISTEPAPAATEGSSWTGPDWSGIQLDEHPVAEPAQEPQALAPRVFLAPLGLRLLSAVVDSSLILAAFFALAGYLVSHLQHVPANKPAETLALGGLVLAGFLYHLLFFAAGLSTPGMLYAGIALCTFDDEIPTPAQLRSRLGAMFLSLAPVGLGFAWSIFDEDHLSWHDRISKTYLRKK